MVLGMRRRGWKFRQNVRTRDAIRLTLKLGGAILVIYVVANVNCFLVGREAAYDRQPRSRFAAAPYQRYRFFPE